MQTDPGEVAFLTTPSQKLRPQPFQTPPTPIRQTEANKKIPHLEKLPESTYEASFTPHRHCPVVKARPKNLVEGFPSLNWDRRCPSYVSHHNTTFQGAWGTAAKPVEQQHCSVVLGDPVKIVERETTHAASFSWPAACRPPVVTERLKLNLEHYSQNSWSTTSREAFCYRKQDPVVLIKRDHDISSLPKGDTDKKRNKERMSFTTNRISFPDNHSECSVCLPGADLMTKSHVQFGSPCLSNLYYSTTAKEHYCKRDGERARPAVQLSGNMSGPEHKLNPSTTETDYLPLKTRRQTPCL
ncbi:uncharacterized protein LOC142946744 isoform X2 [Anarhichas minor]|uniref:uncharacterized protein LOC142946744 isoform X2 n=1 Tax=Anarhichas minor TaxID=65739 RepID=UPI003F734EF9